MANENCKHEACNLNTIKTDYIETNCDDCGELVTWYREEDISEVVTLALCEASGLILKPDVLYKFEDMAGCARCAELAELAKY